MTKKQFASSAPGKGRAENAKHISDRDLDFSDIPQSTDAELTRSTRVGRPKAGQAKQLIAFRIDPRLLSRLRKLAAKKKRPYQTLLHELLESAMEKAA